ncbi:oleate hydratase [Bradyrhizobium sp. Pha-3]|uniref:oleate hydratase n=1 Tax=Bradyrhizobium sp. Pha-3 TaxID=208375 RepID=UPI0035D3EBE3
MPRMMTDRPKVVPTGSGNLAFIGQFFCEIPDDVVFTVEYSVRSAQTASSAGSTGPPFTRASMILASSSTPGRRCTAIDQRNGQRLWDV